MSIKSFLYSVEKAHDITIVYAAEMGSRNWNLDSKESDYDIHFVYVHNSLPAYLGVDPKSVCITQEEGYYDAIGYDIRKAMTLLRNLNPAFVESLNAVTVYIDLGFQELVDKIVESATNTTSLKHYYHRMLRSNTVALPKKGTIVLKKYFNIIRPALTLAYLADKKTVKVPCDMLVLIEAVDISVELKAGITKLIMDKKSGKGKDVIDTVSEIDSWCTSIMNRYAPPKKSKKDVPINFPSSQLFDEVIVSFIKRFSL